MGIFPVSFVPAGEKNEGAFPAKKKPGFPDASFPFVTKMLTGEGFLHRKRRKEFSRGDPDKKLS